jgi:PTS system nitrogen regulatory IIA component
MLGGRKRVSLGDAAVELGVASTMLERWVRQGLVASHGDERGVWFDSEELRQWARAHGVRAGSSGRRGASFAEDYLARAIERGVVLSGSRHRTVADVIQAAVAGLVERGRLAASDQESLIEKVLERELMASTALGGGVAVPHPREPQRELVTEPMVAVIFPSEPVDWAAPDGLAVHTAFLLLSPNSREHLQVLSRLAFAMRSDGFGDGLVERPSKDELVARLRSIHKDA